MHIIRPVSTQPRRIWMILLLLSILVLMSACGSDFQFQQQAIQGQDQLDRLLQRAQGIGVPSDLLQPITQQEQQLVYTNAPFTLFTSRPTSDYYHNLSIRYKLLQIEVQGLIATVTERDQAQAQRDIQALQTALTQRRGLPTKNIVQTLKQYQEELPKAITPKDYIAISAGATTAIQSLNLMQSDADQMRILKSAIDQMQKAHIDVTAMQTQYQLDQQAFVRALTPTDFQQLNTQIEAQYQQTLVNSTLAIPYVAAAKLREFEQQVQQLHTYGLDTAAYQKRLYQDQAILKKAVSTQDYAAFLKQIEADIASMHNDLVQGEAVYLVREFHNEASTWGTANAYHDAYDGQNYPLDGGYLAPGIGSDLDTHLSQATTPDDFQSVVDEANRDLFNLHMLEVDYKDHTPYDQVHATDRQMLTHYNLQKGQIIVVSLVEQAMRIYQDGKLVRAFYVTTGRFELPALPGVWSVLDRESPTLFKSVEPPGSPYWYPDTPIHYAILYHNGGYFIHDSWWRADYGPGTQFPHSDSGGDVTFSNNGSHGCINMQLDQAAWVYNNTDWQTQIVVY
ncbi:MAG TPA: L,D-transpeptidase [Ktedonosporobacter sp.]|nr:L,D-transpeptidase [Ktedonosporobacter sp.]